MKTNIKTRRWGLTQQEIADRLHVTKATVCKWQLGRVPADKVLRVEEVTGISRHDLRPDLYPREGSRP